MIRDLANADNVEGWRVAKILRETVEHFRIISIHTQRAIATSV